MGLKKTDTLLVHSSLKSIGETENGADTVLDAFCAYFSDGLLVLPSHTWSDINAENPIYDVRNSKSCIGILPELFRQRPGVIRSLHPTHSVSAFGTGAKDFVRGQELLDTPCAPDSCYGKLKEKDAKILLVGVNFSRNTTVHCIEETANVPNRLSAHTEDLYVLDYDGKKIHVPSYRHHNANSDYYVKLEPVMLHRNTLHETRLGDAQCMLMQVRDLFSITLELLEKNIRLFDDAASVPSEWF